MRKENLAKSFVLIALRCERPDYQLMSIPIYLPIRICRAGKTFLVLVCAFFLVGTTFGADASYAGKSFRKWTLQEALEVLTQSPWSRQETFTRVVGGIGSGIAGEKEIYSTFFLRFLSAQPVREALARVRQILSGYDQMDRDGKKRMDAALEPGLRLDVHRYIVLALEFRSNDPNLEMRVRQALESQTTETIKSRVYLSTDHFQQIEIAAYFPPEENIVGARFVFPRRLVGIPVVFPDDVSLVFELDVPGFDRTLRLKFDVPAMLRKGEPAL
jgi:hypothetical protein